MQEKGSIDKVSIRDFIETVNKSKAGVSKIEHDQDMERRIVWLLGGVISSSFVSLLIASCFGNSNNNSRILAEYSQAAGTTSLGALVVLLSRKRNTD